MSESEFDVIIVGAGPAGTSAAIRCALAGVNVCLMEQSRFPRHRPGETLHPGIEPLLRQLGVWEWVEQAGFVRHAGIRVCSPSSERFEPFGSDANGQWLGLQAWRADFDQILLDRAVGLGVRILQPCSVKNVIVKKGVVVGVESDQGTVLADFVIDGSGGRHWLAREMQLPMQAASSPLLARFGYWEGDYPAARDAPTLTTNANGWTWIARVRERTYQWTRLSLSREAGAADSEPPVELQTLAPIGHVCGADVTWRCAELSAGPGYFLCGDAAAVLDPASSHGVLKATMSGIYAGHLIEQTFSGIKSRSDAAIEYSEWLNRWFWHDVAELRDRYSLLKRRSKKELRPG